MIEVWRATATVSPSFIEDPNKAFIVVASNPNYHRYFQKLNSSQLKDFKQLVSIQQNATFRMDKHSLGK